MTQNPYPDMDPLEQTAWDAGYTAALNDEADESIWDDLDNDMFEAGIPAGEIVGLITHWKSKYRITEK